MADKSDEAARREEERLMRALNKQPTYGNKRTSWAPPKESQNVGVKPPQPVSTPSSSTPDGKKESWRDKRDREERERRENEERERQARSQKLREELGTKAAGPTAPASQDPLKGNSREFKPSYGSSSNLNASEPKPRSETTPVKSNYSSSSSTTPQQSQTSAERAISNFRAQLQEDVQESSQQQNQQQNQQQQYRSDPTPPPPKNDTHQADVVPFDEIDNLIVSLERPKDQVQHISHEEEPSSSPERTYNEPQQPSNHDNSVNETLDALDSLLSSAHKAHTEQNAQPSYVPQQQRFSQNSGGEICHRCNEQINGERIVAMGKKWHKDHFTCIKCNRVITDTYVATNDQPYCEDCHQQSLICGKCGGAITGAHIDAKGKLYHLECVGGDSCAKCGRPVNTGQVSVQAADRIWHTECFACARCSKLLKDTFVRKEGEIWCKDCYTTELVCDKCGKTLGGQYITTKNKKFHSDCFTCFICHSGLGTDYYDIDGQFQCEKCYNTTIGGCETCGKSLTGQYVKCLGKMFHEGCFVCKSCNGSLGEEFYNVGGHPHCFNCASR